MCVRGEVKAEYPFSLELVLFLIQDFDVLGLELTPAAHCILHDKTDSDSTVRRNGPFPSSLGPLFQNEGRCSAFDMEIIFHSHANKTHFHKKGCAPSLILKVRVLGTRK